MWFYRGHTKLARKKKEDDNQDQQHQDKTLESSTLEEVHLVPRNHTLLESRVGELEMILREYFLNVEYLDALRLRREELLPVYQPPTNPVARDSDVEPPRKSITGNDWRRST